MSKNINMPKLRFREFSGEWEEKILGNIATFSKGKGISKSDIDENGQTECIRYGELYTQYKELIQRVISKTNVDVKDLVLSEFGDIIIPASGETQIDIATASCILKDNVALGGDLNIIKTKEAGVFLSYYLNNSKKFDIARLSQGISVVHLYSSQLKTLKLNLPQKQEQEKIASFLISIDTKIEQLTKKESLLQEYKKGVMQKIFSQEIRFKADNGSEFCEWEGTTIEKNISNIGGTPLEKFVSEKSTYKFISIGNYSIDGKYIDNGQRVELNEKTKTKLLNQNELVMVLNDKTSSGDIIGSSILIDEDNKYIYNQRSERIICKDSVLPLYLWHYFNSKYFRKKVFSLAQGGTQIYINFSSIKSISIKLPSLQEQEKIANFLSSIDKKIEVTKIELEKTKEFKKALLQQMFV